MSRSVKRCALYTRKSSDDGLEQAFNSLDAQREACAAYVKSQASEGWKALPDRYDDGGISGGTMDRPALQRLLADIAANRVDVVVVYKIDRLTRSLADFARMVELFERHDVSFVSVTQSFNTTTSMGRLTLNVLLSFAQFEREVTGERIRDKIAASKKKGMWMGGRLPLGYDAPSGNGVRALVVNEAEAETVRTIFRTYLGLGSVSALERWLDRNAIRSKRYLTAKGRAIGGQRFSRGALFHLLRNRTYLGLIVHGKETHPGLHLAIVEQDLFDAVQGRLDAQMRRRAGCGGRVAASPLAGRIFDCDGQPMTPTFAYGRGGKLYRYHVSAPLHTGQPASERTCDGAIRRLPAADIEARLQGIVRRVVGERQGAPPTDPQVDPLSHILRVEVHRSHLAIFLPVRYLPRARELLDAGEHVDVDPGNADRMRLDVPLQVRQRGSRCRIVAGQTRSPKPDASLVRALRCAHAMLERDIAGRPFLDVAPDTPYRRKLVRLAFLAPQLQSAILAGRQPPGLTLTKLMEADIPASWDAQVAKFGLPRVD
ncbi:MAG: recombinase family protein [Rhodobacteraceae bacterium]|nr:recombinase family protein [Paracoccaceae bacterium]